MGESEEPAKLSSGIAKSKIEQSTEVFILQCVTTYGHKNGHNFHMVFRFVVSSWLMQALRTIVSREQARVALQPYANLLEEKMAEAFQTVQDMLSSDPEYRLLVDSSIQAAMVYRKFVTLLESSLIGDPKVTIKRVGRMVMFYFGSKIRLRFKKFDPNLRSANVRTKHQEGIYHQLVIPGLDNDLTDLTFGYLPDRVGKSIIGIYVTCPRDWKLNHWRIEFRDPMMGQNLFTTSTPPANPIPVVDLPIIRPKTAGRRKVVGE